MKDKQLLNLMLIPVAGMMANIIIKQHFYTESKNGRLWDYSDYQLARAFGIVGRRKRVLI